MTATVEIPLTMGLKAVVDQVDLGLVSRHKWCASRGHNTFYALANWTKPDGSRTMVKLHRLIMGAQSGELVDHRDRNGLNNRRSNLRLCSPSQNGGNAGTSRRNKSGYRGVFWDAQLNRWRAYIEIDRHRRHLGLYDDPWEAAQVYNATARDAWGEFAYQNERIVTQLLGGSTLRKAS